MKYNDIIKKLDHLFTRPALFYDIEVYKHDSFVVFKNIDKEIVYEFVNDFDGLIDVLKNHTIVGYNNYHYDDLVVSEMARSGNQVLIKRVNDRIIAGQSKGLKSLTIIESVDVFQQIDVSFPSLKMLEANRGSNIKETSIGFDIDRKLTDEELLAELQYCRHDVDETIEAFKLRLDNYFTSKDGLIRQMYEKGQIQKVVANHDLDTSGYKRERQNTTGLSALFLMGKRPNKKWSALRLDADNTPEKREELLSTVPHEVREMWTRDDYTAGNYKGKTENDEKRLKKKHTVYALDCKIEFSFGGLHGVNHDTTLVTQKKRFKDVILLDVASMYPNTIKTLNALGDATPKFVELIEQRLEAKHSGNSMLSASLKLVINSVYGLLKAENSLFYNPRASTSVCAYGQIWLYKLCEMLYNAGYSLVNINTDGVAFVSNNGDYETYKQVWKEWEQLSGFELEEDKFDLFIQKSVNDYIGVNYHDDGDDIKVKGGDVSKRLGDRWFSNNSVGIISEMVVQKLVYDKEFTDTILDNLNNPVMFQYILRCGGTYDGTCDQNGNMYQKINRIFPAKNGDLCLFKKKGDSRTLFPSAPARMLIHNEALDKIDINFIDFKYYIARAERVLGEWS